MTVLDFKFGLHARVFALDTMENSGLVMRRYATERWYSEDYSKQLEEPITENLYWVVMDDLAKNGPGNYCEFLEADLKLIG